MYITWLFLCIPEYAREVAGDKFSVSHYYNKELTLHCEVNQVQSADHLRPSVQERMLLQRHRMSWKNQIPHHTDG